MSKLIYSASFEKYTSTYADWQSTTSSVYRSIAYTGDGYIITHGVAMKTAVDTGTNPYGLSMNLTGQQLTVGVAGETASVTLPIIGAENGTYTTTSITNGVLRVNHANSGVTASTVGATASSSSTVKVPKITVDAQGHATAVAEFTATLNKVRQNASSGSGNLLFTASSTGSTDVEAYFNTAINVSGGELSATSFKENGTKLSSKYAPIAHASTAATYGTGTGANYGHVKLSDSITSSSSTSSGVAATPAAVKAALDAAKELFATNDAMVFAGTINHLGVIQTHNPAVTGTGITNGSTNITAVTTYRAGWNFRITSSGAFPNLGSVEAGDMLVCVKNRATAFAASDWTILQSNIDGAVTAAAALPANSIILGAGNKAVTSLATSTLDNGKVLKVVGGVPSWGSDTNTDTWRTIQVGGTDLLTGATSTGKVNFVAGANSGITVVGAGNNITIGSNFSELSIFNGADASALASYSPTSALSIAYAGGLVASNSSGKVTVGHSNTITALTTNKLGSIKYDANGHITGFTEVTSLKNPNAVTFGVGSSVTSYDGSAAVAFKIATGTTAGTGASDFSLAAVHSGGTVTITPTYTRKYRPVGFYANSTTTTVTSAHIESNFDQLRIKPGNTNVTLGWDSTNKAVTISTTDTNTWRKVTACKLSDLTSGQMLGTSTGTADLDFSSDFAWSGTDENSAKINIVWTEIDAAGAITYAV